MFNKTVQTNVDLLYDQLNLVFNKNTGYDLDNWDGVDDSTKLSNALTEIGTTRVNLLISNNITITSNITIPENIEITIKNSAIITVTSPNILTINGFINAGIVHIFSCIGGNIKLSNNILFDRDNEIKLKLQKNHLIKFLLIQNTRAFLVGRIFFSTINSLLVLSGAFASIRKNILLKINGFDIDTVGEDMELILRIHEYMLNDKKSYQIKYLHDAICWTQAPTTLNDLKKHIW